MKLGKGHIFFFVFCLFSTLNAQNFKWLKGFGSRYDGEEAVCVHADKSDGGVSTLVHRFFPPNTNADTIFFDSLYYDQKPLYRQHSSYLIKQDKWGKVKKSIFLGHYSTESFVVDDSGNYYIAGSLYDTFTFKVGNKYWNARDGHLIFIKYDKDFNLIWQTQHKFIGWWGRMFFSENRILFTCRSNKVVYGEVSKYNGKIIWYKEIGDGAFLNYGLTVLKNNIYLAGLHAPPIDPFVINGDTFPIGSGYVIRTDSVGNYIKGFSVISRGWNDVGTISTDGKNLFIGGRFRDTVTWGNKKITPEYPYAGYLWEKSEMYAASLTYDLKPRWFYRPKQLSNLGGSGFLYCSVYSDSFLYFGGRLGIPILVNGDTINNQIVILKTDLLGNVMWATSGGSSTGQIFALSALAGKAVYAGGGYTNTMQFGNLSSSSRGDFDVMVTQLSDNAIIRGKVISGPYCAGDTIRIPYVKLGDYETNNKFIAELSDENGEFNGSEIELGRLTSDTNGVIVGKLPLFQVKTSNKYRIRILSTAPAVQSYYKADTLRLLIYSRDKAMPGNDTTICKGDTIKLNSVGGTKWTWSPKYKMKDSTARETLVWPDKTTTYKIIISDSSGCGEADTAFKTINVRKDIEITFKTPKDTVCKNASIQSIVSFKEGDSTSYSWYWVIVKQDGSQVALNVNSNKTADTINYTLSNDITDSLRLFIFVKDACSNKNFVKSSTVYIKKSKSFTRFAQKDTAICPGSSASVIANFIGADAKSLNWIWQEKNTFNQWVNRKSANNKQADTFNYTMPTNWKGQKQLRTILTDNCSGLKDTAVYNITPRDTLQLQLNTQDTTLCKGQLYTYKAIGKGGNKEGYKYVWTDIASGDTLSTSDSLKIHADTSLTIRLVLNDGCMPKTISRQFTITVRAPLKITINNPNDTVLCDGQSLTYKASAAGGNGQFNYHWLENTTTISNKDSAAIQHNTNQATTRILQVVLSDGCTLNNDTASIKLHYKAPLSQSLNVIDSLCFGAKATLKTKASGGIDNYVYQWQSNNTTVSSTDSLKITNTQPGKFTYTSIVTDACSSPDTITIDIVNLDPLKIQLSTADSCPTGSALIVSQVTGGLRSQLTINWYNKSTPIYQGSTLSINPSNYSDKIFTAVASDGCSIQNDTASLRIGSSPKVKISAIGECLGDTAQFTAKQLNQTKATSYQWRLNGQALAQTDSIAKHFFTQTGPYKIRVDVSSNNSQCKGSDSLTGFILVKPIAAFTLAHFERTASGIPFKFINQSSNDNTWLWQFGNGDTSQRKHPNYSYADTGKFKVTIIVSNQDKCFDSTSLLLPVMDKIEFFYPNAFSPNGNGINESFGLSANQWNKVKEYNLKIYNRWGEKVFDSDHMEEHWRGDKAQQAVYIYKANIRDVYNVLHEIEGVVEVLE